MERYWRLLSRHHASIGGLLDLSSTRGSPTQHELLEVCNSGRRRPNNVALEVTSCNSRCSLLLLLRDSVKLNLRTKQCVCLQQLPRRMTADSLYPALHESWLLLHMEWTNEHMTQSQSLHLRWAVRATLDDCLGKIGIESKSAGKNGHEPHHKPQTTSTAPKHS